MVAIKARTSAFRRGRPSGQRERQRQNRRQPWRCQVSTVAGVTRRRWRRPVPVETADDEPEELVTGAEAGPGLATGGDLKLLAKEQVLEEQAPAAKEDAGEGSEEEPEEFDHPRQDRPSPHSCG